MNFIAMDFETANHEKHSACSLALVMVRNSKIVGEYYSLIKPETPFSGAIFKFTGFILKMLQMPPNFPPFGKKFPNITIKTA